MQSNKRIFGDLARMASGAMSMAAGARDELELLFQQRFERFLNEKGWINREEFEAVRALAQKAREEQMEMSARLERIEAQLAGTKLKDVNSRRNKNKPSKTVTKHAKKDGA